MEWGADATFVVVGALAAPELAAADGLVLTGPRRASQVQLNRAAGNAFRDEMAGLLQDAGRDVTTEVYKKTPLGPRFIDIEVSQDGRVLSGVETKLDGSRYTPSQRAKDWWLKNIEGYPINVVRDK